MSKKYKDRKYNYLLTDEEWTLICNFRRQKNLREEKQKKKFKNFEKTTKTVKTIIKRQNTPVLSKDPLMVYNNQKVANKLNENLPRSEQWFWTRYRSHSHTDDIPNGLVGEKIGDVVNHIYKYVIEIDGSIHNSLEQKQKDKQKDKYLQFLGYSVFRIEAYNFAQYEEVLKKLLLIRQ